MALEHSSPSAGPLTTKLEPTIYYKQTERRLFELVDVFIQYGTRPTRAIAKLSLGTFSSSKPVSPDREFGEERLEFEVPETDVSRKGSLRIDWDGRVQVFPVSLSPSRKWAVLITPNVQDSRTSKA